MYSLLKDAVFLDHISNTLFLYPNNKFIVLYLSMDYHFFGF